MMLVTLDEAKTHVRLDHDAEDDDLTLKIEAASGAVLRYLKLRPEDVVDSADELVVDSSGATVLPAEARAAVLLLTGMLFTHRTADDPASWPDGYLPLAVKNLLLPSRIPTFA